MFFVLLIIFVVAFVEMYLDVTWNAFYYRFGIPVYKRTFKANDFPGRSPTASELETAVPQDVWTGMTFHQLDKDLIAFREKLNDRRLFRMKYTPLMHGAMKFEKEAGAIKVVGFLNWFPVLFVLMFTGFFGFMSIMAGEFIVASLIFLLLMIGIFTFIFLIQRSRFDMVGETAVKLWSRSEIESFSLKEWLAHRTS